MPLGREGFNDSAEEPQSYDLIRRAWMQRNGVQDFSLPENLKAETEIVVNGLPLHTAKIILRDDDGPTDKRSSPEKFIEFRPGKFIDLKFLDTVPAYHAGQLEFCDE